MGYRLRDHVTFCDVAGRLIFLDVAADRYFCLSDTAEAQFRAVAGQVQSSRDVPGHALQTMIEERLLIETDGGTEIQPCRPPPPPMASLLEGISPSRKAPTLGTFARLVASIVRLRVQPLDANLSMVSAQRRRSRRDADNDALAAIACEFASASRWLSSTDRCLAQSLAVARTARRSGIPVTVVFGVSLGPFEAHCWVQCGDTVVNDRVDTVTRFMPILVC